VKEFTYLSFHAFALDGKAPPYSGRRGSCAGGDNLALVIGDSRTGRRLFYAPGLARVGPRELGWMRAADCVLADGTFWRDDEMSAAGLSHKSARDMGHLPQGDHLIDGTLQPGMMKILAGLPAPFKLLVHINNTNPVLDENGPERRELARHGIAVARDGMEILL
jgi:pyrroloquinoline quinone biosynthesis protein B